MSSIELCFFDWYLAFLGCKHWNIWIYVGVRIFILASIWLALSRKKIQEHPEGIWCWSCIDVWQAFLFTPAILPIVHFHALGFSDSKLSFFMAKTKSCYPRHVQLDLQPLGRVMKFRATENRLIISTWPCSGIIIGIWWNMLIENDWKQPNWWPYSLIHFEAYCFVFGTAFPVSRKWKVTDFSK